MQVLGLEAGGGVKPRCPKGRAVARGLDAAARTSNTLLCQRDTKQ